VEFLSHPAFLGSSGSRQRADRHVQAEEQQHHPAYPPSPLRHQAGKALIPPDSRWLLRFSTRSPGEELQRLIAAEKFRATLPAKLDAAEDALARDATYSSRSESSSSTLSMTPCRRVTASSLGGGNGESTHRGNVTKAPVKLSDLFRYYKQLPHQMAAIVELEAALIKGCARCLK
jgi:hypothetical protein